MSQSIQVYHPQPLLPAQKQQPSQSTYFRDGLWLLNHCLAGQVGWFVLAFLLLVVSAITAIFEWWPVAYLVDYWLGKRPDLLTGFNFPALPSSLLITSITLLLTMVLLVLLHSLTTAWAELAMANGGRRLGYQLRMALFAHLQQIAGGAQDPQQINALLRRAARDVIALENFVTGALPASMGNLLLLLSTFLFLWFSSREMAWLSLVIVLILAGFFQHFARQLELATQAQQEQENQLANMTQDLLLPVRVVQPYSHESYTQHRFAEYNQSAMATARQAAARQVQFIWSSKALEALAIALVIGLGLWLITQASITAGLWLLCILLIQRLFKPTCSLIQAWHTLDQIYASIERIGTLLDPNFTFTDTAAAQRTAPWRGLLATPTERHTTPLNLPITATNSARTLSPSVRPAPQTLQNARLLLNPGEMLALVCPTATGGQIITELLANLHISQTGQIIIGDADARRSLSSAVPAELDVLLHEPILFNSSVAENIAYGCVTATQQQISAAALQANAHALIENLPQGYATLLGEQGVKLAAEERYCIAMARACLRNAPILILEVPTIASQLVTSARLRLMADKTILLIAHDRTQIDRADKIIVLKNGKIEEMYTQKQTPTITTNVARPANQPGADTPPATAAAFPLPNGALELRYSPQLENQFPGITVALDAEVMRQHLQNALIGPLRSRDYTITRCTVEKANVQPSEGCLLVYALEVREHAGGQTWSPSLLARLFATQHATQNYLRQQLMPLAAQVTEFLEITPFVAPFVQVGALNLVVQLFPLDSQLPALVSLTNPELMIDLFQRTLPEAQNKRFLINECAVNVVDYAQQAGCLLRYQIDGKLTNTRKIGRQIIYGKVAAERRGELTGPILAALRQRMQEDNVAYRFQLPHFVAYDPALQLVLLEEIRGLPQLPQLLTAYVQRSGSDQATLPLQPGTLTLEKALDASARIATALHTSRIGLGQPRTLTIELATLQANIDRVRPLSPALASRLQAGLQAITAFAATTTALPLCFSHGDFTITQPRFDQTFGGLMDFDRVCQAEPALDLGQFQATLQVLILDATQDPLNAPTSTPNPSLVDQLCAHFLRTYTTELGYSQQNAEQLHRRVRLYAMLGLLRLVLRSWQAFETERLLRLLTCFEAQLATLHAVQHPIISSPTPRYRQNSLTARR